MDINKLRRAFASYFNSKSGIIVRAPGRVNLIGEHTDYNDGFVLPMAIDRAVWLALRRRDDKRVRIYSLDLKVESAFDLSNLAKGRGWIEYAKGVADQLMRAGYELRGFDAILSGDVPQGAGLSSSAAMELAIARAFAMTSNFAWDKIPMAGYAQKAENEWVGVHCGIMDQMASAICKQGHALFLDCRSLEYQHVALPKDVAIIILDTSTRHKLADSSYNERRSQCEEAARWFGVKKLRDISLDKLNSPKAANLNRIALKRARHVVTENARVLDAVDAMKTEDTIRLGELFNESHTSLRDDFEVTNEALNIIVESAQRQSGCYGARMTGAGFGGCAVALVQKEKAREFTQAVSAAYRQRSGWEPSVYICQPSDGASIEK